MNTNSNSHYDNNKQKYELQDNIAQGMYIKIDRTKPYGDLKRWWKLSKDNHYEKLIGLAQREADDYMLDTLKWISFDDLEAKLPKGEKKNRPDGICTRRYFKNYSEK